MFKRTMGKGIATHLTAALGRDLSSSALQTVNLLIPSGPILVTMTMYVAMQTFPNVYLAAQQTHSLGLLMFQSQTEAGVLSSRCHSY